MINENLKSLRKINQYTQEELAEKLNVSRQSIAKWESGESIPDICSCIKLAKLYNVKLDDLVNHSEEKTGIIVPPKGKFFFGAVVVGERGQIVIPKEAREVFNINAGDKLLVLGDEERGLGIFHQRDLINFIGHVGVVRKEE
ncbi:HTH-type transcriptional regulator immR [Clostridioides difficile]|uniref:helix-turn-helix transcriptional regulator n=1 Tax=Clostridioides difficile TaxID=1496 RepID=UPI00097FD3DB|nr:helix-turn-helix transcriptional regulator [Clostridioides difficile]MBY1965746.1 helix-turn-helix transcriptional regulator [Clostridioides difficile]SJR17503.1 HTH-type transcriptional regulator immR [Clostridioides difficile]SJT40398.1 HTH-type transcriptional regulator immR [Clostridioides difficile]HBG1963139.1 helix-turn-helix transcriptional regulator [Clostridioides difficile]